MTTHNSAVDHSDRRLLIALPEPYDAAREHYETLVFPQPIPRASTS